MIPKLYFERYRGLDEGKTKKKKKKSINQGNDMSQV